MYTSSLPHGNTEDASAELLGIVVDCRLLELIPSCEDRAVELSLGLAAEPISRFVRLEPGHKM